MQPQQPVVVGPQFVTRYQVNVSLVRITAILHIVAAVVTLVVQILYISIWGLLVAYASGWWSWILFLITGCMGFAAQGGGITMVKGYVGMSVFSAFIGGVIAIMWILGMVALSILGWSGAIVLCVVMMLIIAMEITVGVVAAVSCYRSMAPTLNTFVVAAPTVQYAQPVVFASGQQQTMGAYPQQTVGAYPSVQQTAYPASAQQTMYPPAQQNQYPPTQQPEKATPVYEKQYP